MPYKLRKAPKRELFWVVNTDTGKKHSIEPIPRDRAQRQMNLLRGVEHGFVPTKGYRSPVKGGEGQMEYHALEKSRQQWKDLAMSTAKSLEKCERGVRGGVTGGKSPKKDCCEELKVERRKRKLLEDQYVGDWK